jgi:glutathione S-transferase
MLKIWGRANSINVQKVMWTVGELGLEHLRHDAGGKAGGLDTPEFTAMNPHRTIPVIDDDGVVVWESGAIIRYLAAKYGAGSLWPEDPAERAAGDQWAEWTHTLLQPVFLRVFQAVAKTPPQKQNVQRVMTMVQRLGVLYRRLDAHLASRPFMAGDQLTIGDIPAGATLYRYCAMDIPGRPDLPNLKAWHERLREREAYRQHVEVPW